MKVLVGDDKDISRQVDEMLRKVVILVLFLNDLVPKHENKKSTQSQEAG